MHTYFTWRTEMLMDEIVVVGGQHWKIRTAWSMEDAMDAIMGSRATGSVGGRTVTNDMVIADVVQVNSDGTERKPYTEAY